MIEHDFRGVVYEVLTTTSRFSGAELFKVKGSDIWVTGGPEAAIKYYLKTRSYGLNQNRQPEKAKSARHR